MELYSFNRIYNNKKGFLSLLDGRVKTIVFISAIIISTTLRHWYLVILLWSFAILGFYTLNISWKKLIIRLSIPFGIAWLVFLSTICTNGNNILTYIPLWGYRLNIYNEGLSLGILLMLRIMTAVTLACVLSFSTPMIEILETFRMLKFPSIVIDLADMMYRYIFIINETAKNMRYAQLSRMGYNSNWINKVKDFGQVATHVMIKSLDKSIKVYNAMLSRGYNENSASIQYFNYKIPKKSLMYGCLFILILVVLVIINFTI